MAILTARDDLTEPDPPDIFRASNGLVIQLKKVSRLLIAEAGRKVVMPRVPTTYLEDKDREEENPNDPDYLIALQNAKYDQAMTAITIMLALGTKIVSELPSHIVPEEDEEWFEIVEALGINILPGNKRMRYAAWLKYVALNDGDDFDRLIKELSRFCGLTVEADVGEAEANFRGSTQRNGVAKDTFNSQS